jgi:1-acyl-sn-glycerol-3-phosphate acyltransferase
MTPDAAHAPSLAQRAFYWFCWSMCMLFFTLVYRLRRHHMERLPRTGPLLVAANHQSHFDPPAIGMGVTSRPLHFLAREGLFKNRLFGWLITAVNSVPVSEEESDVGAIRTILARLSGGVPVLIFPEGSRSPDGELQEFKRGIALLLKRAKCPVVPAAIEGAYDAYPRHRTFPRLLGYRIAVMYGHPIAAEELLKDGPDAALNRLKREIESMRHELRAKLRAATSSRHAPRPKTRRGGEAPARMAPLGSE